MSQKSKNFFNLQYYATWDYSFVCVSKKFVLSGFFLRFDRTNWQMRELLCPIGDGIQIYYCDEYNYYIAPVAMNGYIAI